MKTRVLRCLLALALLCGVASADNPLEDREFQSALEAFQKHQYIKVRNIAESRLRKDQGDLIGLYLMAQVYRLDGNAPRCYLYAGLAQKAVEQVLKDTATSTEGDIILHQDLLQTRLGVAMEMGKYEEALLLAAQHDKLYKDVAMEAHVGWSLLKLGRYDECRRRMKAVVAGGTPDEQTTALNTLGALEWEQGNPRAAREYFQQIQEIARLHHLPATAVFYTNKAECEVGLGNFEVAERDYQEAAQFASNDDFSNPYKMLALLATDQGQFVLASDYIQEMFRLDKRSDPAVHNSNWASLRKQFATLLLAAGYPTQAREALEELLRRPERNSGTSDKPYRLEVEVLLLYQDALGLEQELQAEVLALGSWAERVWSWPERRRREAKITDARRRAAALVVSNHALNRAFLPYRSDWVAPTWLLASQVSGLGPGVVAVELEDQIEQSQEDYLEAYFQSVLGEARVAQGRYQEALEPLERAARQLPNEQVLLKARVQANRAICLAQTDKFAASLQAYQSALEADPTVIRRLGLSLPVSLEVEAGMEAAGDALLGSPRFQAEEKGFVLQLVSHSGQWQAFLKTKAGAILAEAKITPEEDLEESAGALSRAFHQALFGPRLSLSDRDIALLQNPPPKK